MDGWYSTDQTNGLLFHSFKPPVAQGQSGSFESTTLSSTTMWRRADRLEAGDLEGEGLANDVLGISNRQVKTWLRTGPTFDEGNVFQFPTAIRSVAVLDYDGDGDADVAAMCASTIEIRDYGTGSAFPSIPITADAIAAVPKPEGEVGDLLAVAFRVDGVANLELHDSTGLDHSTPLFVAAEEDMGPVDLDVHHIFTGDWNKDELIDLFLAHTRFPLTVVLLRTDEEEYDSTSEDFIDRVAFEKNPDYDPVPENVGKPAFWTDGGWNRNVVGFPADSEDAFAVTKNPAAVEVENGAVYGGETIIKSCRYEEDVQILTVKFSLPIDVTLESHDYVQMVYFEQAVEGGYVQGTADHFWSPLPATG